MSKLAVRSVARRAPQEPSAGAGRWLALLGLVGLVIGVVAFAGSTGAEPPAAVPEPSRVGWAAQPPNRPRHPYVGIVAGHWGYDSGTVCPDGLTEADINLDIATRVKSLLEARRYRVDLLQEFDPRLQGYAADALVSIHADSCDYINEYATGFKVARSAASYVPETEDRLVGCLAESYGAATGLAFNENTITPDMTSYHTFSEVRPATPAAIIETGFLYLDRPVLAGQPYDVARGIADGIVCFVGQ